jgi:hypothetical protein
LSPEFEAFLARLYVDGAIRARFLSDPAATASAAGLTAPECAALARIDRVGLRLAARSFEGKRADRARRAPRPWWSRRWWSRGSGTTSP